MSEDKKPAPGAATEPAELHPGAQAREVARRVEIESWTWRRVRALKIFYTHLTFFLIVNFVILIADLSTPGPPWFFYPLLGWGMALGLHAAQTFERLPWFTRDWEQKKFNELLQREHRK